MSTDSRSGSRGLWAKRDHDNDLIEHEFRNRGKDLIGERGRVLAHCDSVSDARWLRHRLNGLDSDRSALIKENNAAESRISALEAENEQLRAKAELADEIAAHLTPPTRTGMRVTRKQLNLMRWLARYDALTKPSSAGVDTEGSE